MSWRDEQRRRGPATRTDVTYSAERVTGTERAELWWIGDEKSERGQAAWVPLSLVVSSDPAARLLTTKIPIEWSSAERPFGGNVVFTDRRRA